jgi:cytochrome c5
MAGQYSSKGIMWATIVMAIVSIAVVVPFTVKTTGSAADAGRGADDVDARIQPVARFEMAKAAAPATGGAPKDGATVYNSVCGACHNSGAAGAPKIDDKAAWVPRVATGKDALAKSAIGGKNAMPPKGGAADLSDDEIKGAVDYILSKVK